MRYHRIVGCYARLSDNMYPKADHNVHLIALPMFHSFGQTIQMNAGIYNRATQVVVRSGNIMVK